MHPNESFPNSCGLAILFQLRVLRDLCERKYFLAESAEDAEKNPHGSQTRWTPARLVISFPLLVVKRASPGHANLPIGTAAAASVARPGVAPDR